MRRAHVSQFYIPRSPGCMSRFSFFTLRYDFEEVLCV